MAKIYYKSKKLNINNYELYIVECEGTWNWRTSRYENCKYKLKDLGTLRDRVFFNSKISDMFTTEKLEELCVKGPIAKGSNLFIAPGCTLPRDMIRKEYNIKRRFEDADYIVVGEINTNSKYFNIQGALVNDAEKKIITIPNADEYTKGIKSAYALASEAMGCVINPSEWKEIRDFPSNYLSYCYDFDRFYYKIIEGESLPDIVHQDQIDLVKHNQIDSNTIELLFKIGREQESADQMHKLVQHLAAMCQCDWEDYKATIRNVIDDCRHYNYSCTICALCGRSSTWPAAIKYMMGEIVSASGRFETEKDYNMYMNLFRKSIAMNDSDIKQFDYRGFQHYISNNGNWEGKSLMYVETKVFCRLRTFEQYKNANL